MYMGGNVLDSALKLVILIEMTGIWGNRGMICLCVAS